MESRTGLSSVEGIERGLLTRHVSFAVKSGPPRGPASDLLKNDQQRLKPSPEKVYHTGGGLLGAILETQPLTQRSGGVP